jgi:hypothetical protein
LANRVARFAAFIVIRGPDYPCRTDGAKEFSCVDLKTLELASIGLNQGARGTGSSLGESLRAVGAGLGQGGGDGTV